MERHGLGRDQVHDAAWGHDWYPHPMASCMMPVLVLLIVISLTMVAFTVWQKTLPGDVTVPDVSGQPQSAAQTMLQRAGLTVEFEEDRPTSEKVSADAVLSTKPEGGRRVKSGRRVRVLISGGSAFTTVPNVMGASIDDAQQQLQSASLQIANETMVFDDHIGYDRIVNISPKAGAKVARDSAVNLAISKGSQAEESMSMADPNQKSSVLTIDIPSDAKDAAELRIDVTDDNGKRSVFSEQHNPGDTVVYTVEGEGDTTAEVYFGDQLILTRNL